MTMIRKLGLPMLAAALLSGCLGGDDSPTYDRVVSFGDSLSDVGSYATPGLVSATGGGRFTVNGAGNRIWVELLAARVGASTPCAAQVGLESSGPFAAFAATAANKANCHGYAQGGSRVTNPIGPWNKALLTINDPSGYLGQLTVPLATQVQRHQTAGGFKSQDLVLVWAGGNDMFMNLGAVGAGGSPTDAVTAMATAGAELATLVKGLVATGASRVVLITLPDINMSPYGATLPAATQGLITAMSRAFNDTLTAGVAGNSSILLVDGYALSQDVTANPAKYGATNATGTACDPAKATLGSLVCSAATLASGDVSKYLYADSVHPSPFQHQLIADQVADRMIKAGWL